MPSQNWSPAALAEDWEHGGFGLYIHWPFCAAKCPYCDFNSHVSGKIDQGIWVKAYLAELDRVAALVPGRVLSSVFFGGGTPSLMAPETVLAILERVKLLWPMANSAEITLEANPGSVEAGRFSGFASAGVNRISMGIQALNDRDLGRLGRLHTANEARAAFDVARAQFDRVSFDLIYARQDQSVAQWRLELREALDMAVDHLSLYQLTIEEGTAFGDRYKLGKLRGLPDEDSAAEMYEATQELCEAAGMPAYETSNHARFGAESRHNLIYWRYGDYAGIGPGAHGRLTLGGRRYATEARKMPADWLSAVESGTGELPMIGLSRQEQASELLLMGMRLMEGVDMARYAGLAGRPLRGESLGYLQDLGMIEVEGRRVRASVKGRIVLNAILAELLTE